jgi:hypothetical protein
LHLTKELNMPWFFIVGFIITFQLWEMNNSKTTSLSHQHMLYNNSVAKVKQDVISKIEAIKTANKNSKGGIKEQCVNGGCCCSSLENCRCSKCNNNDNNDENNENYKQIIKMCENNGVFVRARFYKELKLANKHKKYNI